MNGFGILFVFVGIGLHPYADDPCGYKARHSAIGQASAQLIEVLALTERQRDAMVEAQRGFFERTEAGMPRVELARQRLLDGFLIAAEDDVLSDREQKRLRRLKREQRDVRQELMTDFEQTVAEVAAVLTNEQAALLAGFQPRISLSDEALTTAQNLLRVFREVKQRYLRDGVIPAEAISALQAAIEDARPMIYLPPWLEARLMALAIDFNAYRGEILKALQQFRPLDEDELAGTDLFLDVGVNLLLQALHMGSGPAIPEGAGDSFSQADFHRALLVTPVAYCLLQPE